MGEKSNSDLNLFLKVEIGSSAIPTVAAAMEHARGLLDHLGTLTPEELLLGTGVHIRDPRSGEVLGACELTGPDEATQ